MKNTISLFVIASLLFTSFIAQAQFMASDCPDCEVCPVEKTYGFQGFDFEEICELELQWQVTPACAGEENGAVVINEISNNGNELNPAEIHFDWGSPSKSGNGISSMENAGAGYHQLRISTGEGCEQVFNIELPALELQEMYSFVANEIGPEAGNGSIEITEMQFSVAVENVWLIWQDMPGQVFNPPHIRENLNSGDYTVEILYGDELCSEYRTFTICSDEYTADASYSEDFSGCDLGDDWLQEGFDWYIGESMEGGCHLETRSLNSPLIWQPENLSAYSNGMLYYDFTTFPEWSGESKLKVEYFPPDDIESELDWNSCLFGNVCRAEIYLPPLQDEGYFKFTFGSPSIDPYVVIDNILMEGSGVFHEASCPLEAQFGSQSSAVIQACEGESVYPGELLSVSGGSTSYRFDWDLDKDGQFDDFTGPYPVLDELSSGMYTISVKVTDRTGNTITAHTGLEILSSVPLSISSPDVTIPENGVLDICMESGPIRLITNVPGTVLSGTGLNGDVFDPANTGPGTWLINASKNSCSGRASLLIRVVDMPDISLEELYIRPCEGSVSLNTFIDQSVSGMWSGGVYVDEKGNFDPASAPQGMNEVKFVEQTANCEKVFTFRVFVMEEESVDWQPPTEAVTPCGVDIHLNTLLDAPANASGTWSGGPYIVNDDRFDPSALVPGLYPVVYSAGEGSCLQSQSHFIQVVSCASELSIRLFLENKMRGPGIMERAVKDDFSLVQPFNTAPYHYTGNEAYSRFEEVPAGTADWVLLEYIDPANSQILERSAVLLRVDGTVVDLEGKELLPYTSGENFRIRISHPDHFTIVSENNAADENDFTRDVASVEDPGTVTEVYDGLWAMKADFPLASDEADQDRESIDIAVWPNPATDFITVHLTAEDAIDRSRIDLVAADGRPVMELFSGSIGTGNQYRESFDISSLPAGIYWLRLSSRYGTVVRKVMISR